MILFVNNEFQLLKEESESEECGGGVEVTVIKDEVMRKFYRQQKCYHLPKIEKHITPLVFRKSSLQEYHSNTSKQPPW